MFVAIMAFFARISDPAVGGTYMTLLNTLTNLGGNWPATLALWAVDHLTWKRCQFDLKDVKSSNIRYFIFSVKVEKILKGSLDSVPPPSVKIQIMGGKFCLRCKSKTLLDVVNKLLKTKSLLTSPSNVLPYYLK